MKLYLARHAEALDLALDLKRPLSQLGIANTQRLANFLTPMGVLVSHTYHSSALRTQQTAAILASAIAPGQEMETLPLLNEADAAPELAAQISGWGDDTLLVGHLPLLPRLVGQLVVRNQDQFLIDFVPATLACLQRVNGDRWCIAWVLRPDLIVQN